jgi:transcription termination factor Rho
LRRSLMELSPQEAMESLVTQLAKSPDNATFLAKVNKFIK